MLTVVDLLHFGAFEFLCEYKVSGASLVMNKNMVVAVVLLLYLVGYLRY